MGENKYETIQLDLIEVAPNLSLRCYYNNEHKAFRFVVVALMSFLKSRLPINLGVLG